MARQDLICQVHRRGITFTLAGAGHGNPEESLFIPDRDKTGPAALFPSALEQLGEMRPQGRRPRAILLVSPAFMAFRHVVLPFSSARKVRQVLGFELENRLPFSPGPFVFDFFPLAGEEGGHLFFAAAMKTTLFDALTTALAAQGIEPVLLSPSGMFQAVAIHEKTDREPAGPAKDLLYIRLEEDEVVLVLVSGKAPCLIRTFPRTGEPSQQLVRAMKQAVLGAVQKTGQKPKFDILVSHPHSAQRFQDLEAALLDLFSPLLERAPEIRESHDDPGIPTGLGARGPKPLFNFCNISREEFPLLKRHAKPLILAACLGLMVCLLAGAGMFMENRGLEKEIAAIDRQMTELYLKAFPRARHVRDPFRQLKGTVLALEKKQGKEKPRDGNTLNIPVIDLLSRVSKRIGPDMDLTLTRFTLKDTRLVLHGRTDNFNTVDRIKTSLETDALFKRVDIAGASMDKQGARINCKFIIELGRHEPLAKG